MKKSLMKIENGILIHGIASHYERIIQNNAATMKRCTHHTHTHKHKHPCTQSKYCKDYQNVKQIDIIYLLGLGPIAQFTQYSIRLSKVQLISRIS